MKRESSDHVLRKRRRFCSCLGYQQTSVNPTTLPGRFSRLVASLSAVSCGALLAPAQAQTSEPVAQIAAVSLERFTVSATRTPQDLRYTPSAVSVVPLPALAAAQIADVRTALAQEPGVIVSSTGPTGGLTSILLRGANSDQTLFMVDGVRMSDRSASYNNFLGGADLAGLERIEVLRGPQSTLYGSSAMGGVIVMNTARGEGAPSGVVQATAGSFDTLGGSIAVEGGEGRLGYSASLTGFNTDNQEPGSGFDQTSYSMRLEFAASERFLIGGTFRGQNSEFQQTGSRFFAAPGVAATDNYLGTVYAEAELAESFTSRLTAALHRRAYDWTDLSGSPWATNSALRNKREILDWQNTWEATAEAEIVAGATFEQSRYTIDGLPSTDDVSAGYVSGTLRPVDAVTLTGGVRYDDFESVGDTTTWRTGVAWLPAKHTKLRATYGTGFGAPGSDDRYGVPAWGQLPNPNLEPEKSKGWDVGIDHTVGDDAATLSATYFHNRFENLFQWTTVDFTTFEGRTENVARATTEGVELAVDAKLGATAGVRVSYTYLEAHNDTTGARLIRRPRHSGTIEVRFEPAKGWLVGAGFRGVGDRTESVGDFEDYATVRVFTSYEFANGVRAQARVENALDEKFDDVRGYAALPVAVFGGIEWRF